MSQVIKYPSATTSTYATSADFPPAAAQGAFALDLSSDILYVYETSSSSWHPVQGGGGGGSVTAVTASAPLASSGGTTPNISITQSSTSTDGYLSSTDFNTFNNKQDALTPGDISTSTTGVTVGNGANSTVGPDVTVDIQTASGSQPGLLSAADWTTFNSKQAALTLGNLTDAGTDGITVTGGTGAVVGSGTSIAQHVADSTHNGYLSAIDWSTFNAKQPSGSYITALTGDATASGPGSVPITLATVNGSPGSFGSASTSLSATVNGKGLITALSSQSIQIAESQVTNLVADLASKQSATLTQDHILVGNASNVATDVAMSGDVAIVASGATTIQANVVSNSKLAQMPTLTIKGNNTGGTANAIDLTVAQVNTMLGDILANGTVPFVADQSLGSHKLTNVTDPSAAQDAATKAYVDAAVAALQPLTSVFAASTANIAGTYNNGAAGVGATFTTTATTPFALDGASPAVGQRVLIKDQASGFQNGVYGLTAQAVGGVSGAVLTRTLDYDTANDMNAAGLIPVINGTVNALSSWQQTAVITTVGTDSLVFVEFTANPSLYLLKANNLNDVASASASFINISPLTTAGDLIYEDASPAPARLPIGTDGQILTAASGLPVWADPAASGSVTSVSVVSANGLAGTVATATTTPAITLSTTITGILQGDGTSISAASTTGSGAVVLATSPTLVTPALGTPTALVGTNITGTAAGLTAGNVTTNANLTGPVTSVGNATSVTTNAITNTMLAQMAAHTYKGNNTGSTANALDVTSTQLTADLNQFSSTLQGLVPGSGGGTANFLRADGTWATPPDTTGITQLTGDVTAGPGSGSQASTLATVNGNVGSFGSSTSIPSFTVNGKGLITAASGNAVVAPAGTLSGTTLNATVVSSSLTSVGTIATGVWNGTAVSETHGGTNQTTYATGNTLYASASNTLSKLAIGNTGDVLTVAGGVPTWATPAAPTAVIAMVQGNTPVGTLSSSRTVAKFTTMTVDTNSAYNSTTGLYTVPVAGTYLITAIIDVSCASTAVGNLVDVLIGKNGSGGAAQNAHIVNYFQSTSITELVTITTYAITCAVNDTIGVYVACTGTTPVYSANQTGSSFNLYRLGN